MSQAKRATGAGTLDPSFGEGGVVLLPNAVEVLALPKNKLLVVIYPTAPNAPLEVVRLNENGTFDHNFGKEGIVKVPVYGYAFYGLPSVTLLADGGWLIMLPISGGRIFVRQRQTGELEESFGNGGIRVFKYNAPEDIADLAGSPSVVSLHRNENVERTSRTGAAGNEGGSAVDPSTGKIVFLDLALVSPDGIKSVVWRLNADGSVDKTFNGTGYVVVEPPGIQYWGVGPQSVGVQANGHIVVTGWYTDGPGPDQIGLFVMRFNPDGAVDPLFNAGLAVNVLTSTGYPDLQSISIRESDGRIVVAGSTRNFGPIRTEGVVAVLNASGSFNQVFNKGQPLISNMVPVGVHWRRCAQQNDGAIVVSGGGGYEIAEHFRRVLIARFLSDGSLGPTFNGKGWTLYKEDPEDPVSDDSGRMTTMPDGRIVICGGSDDGSGWVVRYLA